MRLDKIANPDYIVHSRKGSTWKKHKYISKTNKDGKTVYNYGDSNGLDDFPSIENDTWEIREDGKYYINGEEVPENYFNECYEYLSFSSGWNIPKELDNKMKDHLKKIKNGFKSNESIESIVADYTLKKSEGKSKKKKTKRQSFSKSLMLHSSSEQYILHKGIKGWTKKNHKYSFKKMVNGKWRYFYDTKLGGKARKDALSAYNDWQNAINDAGSAWNYETELTNWDDWHNDKRTLTDKYGIKKSYNEHLLDQRMEAQKKRDNAAYDFQRKMIKYQNTPLGKLDDFRTSVSNFLHRKSGKKKSLADTYLSKIITNKYGAILNGSIQDIELWNNRLDYVRDQKKN